MNTDTPRTDEAWAAWPYAGSGMSVHVGRQLERELTAARADAEDIRGMYYGLLEDHKAITEQRDGLKQAVDCASDLLSSVTEQRNEARRLAEKYRNLSCDSQDEADETLLPWEITNPNEL